MQKNRGWSTKKKTFPCLRSTRGSNWNKSRIDCRKGQLFLKANKIHAKETRNFLLDSREKTVFGRHLYKLLQKQQFRSMQTRSVFSTKESRNLSPDQVKREREKDAPCHYRNKVLDKEPCRRDRYTRNSKSFTRWEKETVFCGNRTRTNRKEQLSFSWKEDQVMDKNKSINPSPDSGKQQNFFTQI